MSDPDADLDTAERVTRGVCRALDEQGYVSLTEFTLASGRRADVIALGEDGEVLIVEVKSSAADFRSDGKWHEYLDYCDRFFFAVPEDFPRDLLPAECGLIVADAYRAEELRPAPAEPVHASRRKALTLRIARVAAARLREVTDPRL